MPIVIPPFVQYQTPLFPLRGLWNSTPPEGDRFVTAQVLWGVTTGAGNAVQFDLSGNSPVAFSQIAAFAVDNSHCGSDVQFLFPDSGFTLEVPAYNQGLYPVFTNALMFYASAASGAPGDQTTFQVLNSVPPPIAVQPSEEQSHAVVSGIVMTNGTTQLIPATINGTVQGYDLDFATPTAGAAAVLLQDGKGNVLWARFLQFTTTELALSSSLSGLRLRFFNGLSLVIQNSTLPAGSSANCNIYYAIP